MRQCEKHTGEELPHFPFDMLAQLHGYIWVGCLAFVLDAGILLLLVHLHIYYIIANTLSFTVSNAFNFLAGHYLVFNKKTRLQSLFGSYLAVLSISVTGLLLNNVVMFISVEWISLSIIGAKVLATIMVLMWNFGARKRWVYV